MIPTKLDVFSMRFDVNTPGFIKEASENSRNGMYRACWVAFRDLMAMVAIRATELNDPILNVLMIRMNLYELRNEDRHRIIEDIRKKIEESYV